MKTASIFKLTSLAFVLLSVSGCINTGEQYCGPGHTFRVDKTYFYRSCYGCGEDVDIHIDFTLVSITRIATAETKTTYLLFDVVPSIQNNQIDVNPYSTCDPTLWIVSDRLINLTYEEGADIFLDAPPFTGSTDVHFGSKNAPFQMTLLYDIGTMITKVKFSMNTYLGGLRISWMTGRY